MEVAPSFSHFNKVDGIEVDSVIQPKYPNDVIGLTAGGRVKLFGEFSLLLEYNQSFWTKTLKPWLTTIPRIPRWPTS